MRNKSTEKEKSGIQLGLSRNPTDSLGNAAYVACLLLISLESEWLNGKSVWLAFRRSWVRIPAGSRIFSMDLFLTLSPNKHHSWALTVANSNIIQPPKTVRPLPNGGSLQGAEFPVLVQFFHNVGGCRKPDLQSVGTLHGLDSLDPGLHELFKQLAC